MFLRQGNGFISSKDMAKYLHVCITFGREFREWCNVTAGVGKQAADGGDDLMVYTNKSVQCV